MARPNLHCPRRGHTTVVARPLWCLRLFVALFLCCTLEHASLHSSLRSRPCPPWPAAAMQRWARRHSGQALAERHFVGVPLIVDCNVPQS
jgi:hypothetical protein